MSNSTHAKDRLLFVVRTGYNHVDSIRYKDIVTVEKDEVTHRFVYPLAKLLFREAPYTFATGEDMQLAHMFRKYANAPSLVLPV